MYRLSKKIVMIKREVMNWKLRPFRPMNKHMNGSLQEQNALIECLTSDLMLGRPIVHSVPPTTYLHTFGT